MVDYLENGFQKLQDSSDCHSLLKKHLTREVLDQLKDKKTEQFGSTLKDVVQSGRKLFTELMHRCIQVRNRMQDFFRIDIIFIWKICSFLLCFYSSLRHRELGLWHWSVCP